MLRDSRTKSVLVFIILVCASEPGHGSGPRRGRQDCTSLFKGRTIRLEYLYYKSYWLYGVADRLYGVATGEGSLRFSHRNEIFGHGRKMSWQLHDCQDNHVCLQNRGVNNYWLNNIIDNDGPYGAYSCTTMGYLSDVARDATDDYRFKIFCDSCEHHDRCQVYTKAGNALYSLGNSKVHTCSACGNANWFDWDIVLLTPRERWETVDHSVCNRTPQDQGIHFTNERKVGVSRKVAETHGIGIEISASLASVPLIWTYEGKVTHKREWTKEEVRMSEHTTSVTIRGPIGTNGIRTPPNKKAVLKQLMGYYGDFQSKFTMKSMALEVHIEDCLGH
eukprot:GFUD01110239.1.p1 GENE.GFUD01110239.1~~GFUD01110239.1.p1  ORF type:complete len:333 (-),score=31.37 GFUD01110239.1:110-1108(-)